MIHRGTGSAPGPLDRRSPLEHETKIPVLGVPVRFRSNSAEVMRRVEDAFLAWQDLTLESSLQSSEEVTVRIILQESVELQDEGSPPVHRLPERHRLVVSMGQNLALADSARRDAVAYVTPSLLERHEDFRYNILQCLVLFLVTARDRQPVHASAVMRDDVALLFSGPSGVGKSTVCYAAVRAGLQFMSDEAVYVQQRPTLRLWGLPGPIRLHPSARAHFPELESAVVLRQPNGNEKVVVDPRNAGKPPDRSVVERAGICILRRGTAWALRRITPDELRERMSAQMEPGFDLFAETVPPLVAELGRMGAWEMTVAPPADGAVPWVLKALDDVASAEL